MLFIAKLFSLLPLVVLYRVSSFLALVAGRFYRRKTVIKNIRSAFPEKSETEINSIATGFYQRLADLSVEILKALSISEAELRKRVVFKNPEVAVEAKENGYSLLMFAAHQINWEWMALASSFYFPFRADVIYRPLESRTSDRLMYLVRSRFGGRPIPKSKAVRNILKNTEPRAIGIVADQKPARSKEKDWAMFLNQETAFFRGISQLPYLNQSRAVFCRIHNKARGYYEVEFKIIGEPPYEKNTTDVLKNYISEAERLIKEQPENWLWSHKRWKYQRAENEELLIL